MQKSFVRLQIPADSNSPASVKRHDGRLMAIYPEVQFTGDSRDLVTLTSLAGRRDEGVSVNVPESWVQELSESEQAIAQELESTFWDREDYPAKDRYPVGYMGHP